MSRSVPTITEAELREYQWICDRCLVRVTGPACPGCDMPPPKAMLVIPDDLDAETEERLTTMKRCMYCRHFNIKKGQERLHDERDPLFHRIVEEMGLRSLATNVPWHEMGLCEEWTGGYGDEHMVCATSPARVNKSRVDSSVSRKDKDTNVACEAFAPRAKSDGREIRSHRMVKGSRTVGTD